MTKAKNSVSKLYELKAKPTNVGFESVKISNSKSSAAFARQFYSDDIVMYESFFLILLNKANVAHGWAKISQGGIAGTVVDPIVVAKYCIDTLSSGVVLVHNHPSGNCKPSSQDLDITRRIKDMLILHVITVLDHVILMPVTGYYSLADEGQL